MHRALIICLCLLVFMACTQVKKSEKPIISVSILPQKYFVERITGDKFSIDVITPPGASHETYEPTPRQIKALSESVLFIANGYLLLEKHLIEKSDENLSGKLVDLSQNIDLLSDETVEHGDHVHLYGVDPHYWLSPAEVRHQAKTIFDAVLSIDPGNKDYYRTNYEAFINDIDLLDKHLRDVLSETKTKTFLIYHPAFAYLARDYGLKQIALETEGKEPTGSHLKNIIDIVKREGIKTILVQSQFNMTAAEVVAKEINGKVETLEPLPENWLENMYRIAHTLQKALNP